MKRFVLFLALFLFVNQAHALPNAIRAVVASGGSGADATLVNWWKLNEGTGTTVTDYGSAPKTGTLGAQVSWTTSGGKNVASFIVNSNSLITFASTSYGTTHTVSVCVDFTDPTDLLSLDNILFGGASGDFPVYQNAGTTLFYGAGGSFVSVTDALLHNVWYRLTNVRSGTTISSYVDGSQVGTDQTLGANNTVSASAIGAYADGSFSGLKLMSAVRVYTRALSAGDVGALPSCPE